jgi:hypothetical protein
MTSYDRKRLVSTQNIFLARGKHQVAFADTGVIFLHFLVQKFFVYVLGYFAGLGCVALAGHIFSPV